MNFTIEIIHPWAPPEGIHVINLTYLGVHVVSFEIGEHFGNYSIKNGFMTITPPTPKSFFAA